MLAAKKGLATNGHIQRFGFDSREAWTSRRSFTFVPNLHREGCYTLLIYTERVVTPCSHQFLVANTELEDWPYKETGTAHGLS